GQGGGEGGEGEEGHAEPEALALARVRAQRAQNEPVARADFSPRGEELAQTLLLIFAQPDPAPPDVLLERLESANLRLRARQSVAAVVPRLPLAPREKCELDGRRRVLEPVQPVVIHAWDGGEEKAGER